MLTLDFCKQGISFKFQLSLDKINAKKRPWLFSLNKNHISTNDEALNLYIHQRTSQLPHTFQVLKSCLVKWAQNHPIYLAAWLSLHLHHPPCLTVMWQVCLLLCLTTVRQPDQQWQLQEYFVMRRCSQGTRERNAEPQKELSHCLLMFSDLL